MKGNFVLDTLSAAHVLAVKTLRKADDVFYRQLLFFVTLSVTTNAPSSVKGTHH